MHSDHKRNGNPNDYRNRVRMDWDARYGAPGIAEPYEPFDYQYGPAMPQQFSRGSFQAGRGPGRAVPYEMTAQQLGWSDQPAVPGAFGHQPVSSSRYSPDFPYGSGQGQHFYPAPGRAGQLGAGPMSDDEWDYVWSENVRMVPMPYGGIRRGPMGYRNFSELARFNSSPTYDRLVGREESVGRHSQSEVGFRGVSPKGYQRSAASIRDEVCQRLTDHTEIDPSDIEVSVTDDGTVKLSGRVDTRFSKRLVEDIVDYVRGVRDVRNELEIDWPASITETK